MEAELQAASCWSLDGSVVTGHPRFLVDDNSGK